MPYDDPAVFRCRCVAQFKLELAGGIAQHWPKRFRWKQRTGDDGGDLNYAFHPTAGGAAATKA
jgi:hypothetical protein